MTAWAPRILFAVTLGLSGVVTYQLVAPVPPVDETSDENVPAKRKPIMPAFSYQPPPAERYAIINARPLFDPGRQPVNEPAELGATPDTPPDFTLVGVAIGGRTSVALLKKPEVPSAISATQGQSIDGWQIVKIARDGVVLRAGAREFTLKMRSAKGLGPPATGSPPPMTVTDQSGH